MSITKKELLDFWKWLDDGLDVQEMKKLINTYYQNKKEEKQLNTFNNAKIISKRIKSKN